jgi:hypothetical protein
MKIIVSKLIKCLKDYLIYISYMNCIVFSEFILADGIVSILSNKILVFYWLWQFNIYMSWPNYVPAVAVIRKRLVLFIFIRYKGYLDGKH